MSAIVLDGLVRAEDLPDDLKELLGKYSTVVAKAAVDLQADSGKTLDEMLGVISWSPDEDVAGVALLDADLREELLRQTPPYQRESLIAFLARPVPSPTHLRTLVWPASGGVGMIRIDMVPVSTRGSS